MFVLHFKFCSWLQKKLDATLLQIDCFSSWAIICYYLTELWVPFLYKESNTALGCYFKSECCSGQVSVSQVSHYMFVTFNDDADSKFYFIFCMIRYIYSCQTLRLFDTATNIMQNNTNCRSSPQFNWSCFQSTIPRSLNFRFSHLLPIPLLFNKMIAINKMNWKQQQKNFPWKFENCDKVKKIICPVD